MKHTQPTPFSKEELSILVDAVDMFCEQIGGSFFEEDEAVYHQACVLREKIRTSSKEETR